VGVEQDLTTLSEPLLNI